MQPLPRDARRIPTPAAALGEWLAEIDDLGELKVVLRAVAVAGRGTDASGRAAVAVAG